MSTTTIETAPSALEFLKAEYNLTNLWTALLGQPHDKPLDLYKLEMNVPADAQAGARALNNLIGGTLKYSADTGIWYCWNGRIYEPLSSDILPLQLIDIMSDAYINITDHLKQHKQAEHLKLKASGLADEIISKEKKSFDAGYGISTKPIFDYAKSLASNRGVNDTLAKLKRVCAVADEYFMHDEQYLVVRNGVIDIADYRATEEIRLLSHDPARAVYRYFDADYVADMETTQYETWRRFLATSVIDWDTVILTQKAVGAAFSGEQKPRALFNLLGAPASGKSVFLSVFNRLGQGYSVMPNNQAIQSNNGDTNFYQDALRGARFVGFSEVQGKKSLDDGFIKGIMGGDVQNTRRMRQQESPWKPQCVLFIASNMPLKFDTRDDATFLKVLPIPFPHSFTDTDPDHKMDRELESKVMEERSGILHWVLEGMRLFWRDGLAPTAAVMEAMDGNKTANSSALTFIQVLIDAGHLSRDLSAPVSSCLDLPNSYKIFQAWAESSGIRNIPGKQTYSADIADFYHGKKPSGGTRFVGLLPSPNLQTKLQNPVSLAHFIDSF